MVFRQKGNSSKMVAVSYYRGVLPQLAAGVNLLVERRSPSGLWFEDPWVSSKVLQSLAAYNKQVEGTEELARFVGDSATLLTSWLLDQVNQVEGAADLYPGLDGRLRAMCSCFVAVREVGGPSVESIITRVETAMLSLLEAGAEYAAAIGDLVVAQEVLACIPLLGLQAKEAATLSDPWLAVATRALIAAGVDRVRALQVLLRTRGTILEDSARTVWTREAKRMLPQSEQLPFHEALQIQAKTITSQLKSSDLETVCSLAESRKLLAGQEHEVPNAAEIIRLLAGRITAFRSEGEEKRPHAAGVIALGVKTLSESHLAKIVAFPIEENERLDGAMKLLDRMDRKEAVVVSHPRYTLLQAVTLVLVYAWAVTFYFWQPTLGLVIGLTAALLTGLVALAFRPHP